MSSVNDFEDGTTQGWAEGGGRANSPNPPTNVADGGPAGAGDNFLQNISTGGAGPGGNWVMHNTSDTWTGDYLAAGVTRITAQMRNTGPQAVPMGLALGTQNVRAGGNWFATTSPVNLPNDGDWHRVEFGLDAGSLTQTQGTVALNEVLASVAVIRLVANAAANHQGSPALPGTTIGVDNVQAAGPSVTLAVDNATISESSTFVIDGTAGLGLLPGNENPAVAGGTGGLGPGGISLDAATNTLSIDVLWGSGNGFTDLTGEAVAMHIHGPTDDPTPAGFAQNAGVLVDLGGLTGFSNSATNGGFNGTVALTDEQEAAILANRTYLNVHTAANPPGEIRGNLVAESLATLTATLSSATTLPVTVDLGFSGTATNGNATGTDYNVSSTQITIPAGSTTGTATVWAVNDALDEEDETVIADIVGVTNGSENGVQQVTVTIEDDDPPPSVTLGVDKASISEAPTFLLDGIAGIGLLPGNENPATTGGTGGIGTGGISLDEDTNTLTVDVRWGSENGFTDLTGNAVAMHIHGPTDDPTPAGLGQNAPVLVDLGALAGFNNSATAGGFIGTVVLTDEQEAEILANRTYLNVHTAANPPGEIRGNLVLCSQATFTATLSAPSSFEVTVDLEFTGTATNGTDYDPASNQITIPAGSTSGSTTVWAINDDLDEGDETVIADIADVTNAVESDEQQATTTITDDDPPPTVSLDVDKATISESSTFNLDGTAGMGLLPGNENPEATGGTGGLGPGGILLDAATNTLTIDVLWGSSNGFTDLTGDAVAMHIHGPTDDPAPAGFGQNAGVLVGLNDLPGFNASATEGGFTGAVVLTDEQEAAVLSNRTYINVHTAANPPGEIRGQLVANSLATLTATLSAASSFPVTVDLGFSGTATNGNATGTDYTVSSTQIVIPPGSLTGTATVLSVDDQLDEENETVIVDVTDVVNGTENGTQQATTTIEDDDPPPTVTLAVDRATITEQSTFIVEGNAGLGLLPGNENPAAAGGSGSIGPGGISLDAATNTLTIDVLWGSGNGFTDLTGDAVAMHIHGPTDDPTPLGFDQNAPVLVGLSDLDGFTASASSGGFSGTVVLTDEQEAAILANRTYINVHTAANPPGEIRGNLVASSLATLTASLSAASGLPVTVDLGFDGTATLDTDYLVSSSQITIPAGSLTGTATVLSVDDAVDEADEMVVASIVDVTNASEDGEQQTTTTIVDDESPTVSLAVDKALITEASTFLLDGTAGMSLLAGNENPAATGGSGGLGPGGIELDEATNTLIIDVLWGSGNGFTDLSGDVVAMHIHGPTDDAAPAGFAQNAPVLVGLDGLPGFNNSATNGGFLGVVLLTDEQEAAILANKTYINVHTAANPAGEIRGQLVLCTQATFTATLSATTDFPVTVNLGFSGTAAEGTDFTAAASEITIPAGSLSGTTTVTAINDNLNEADETIVADVIGVTNALEDGDQQVVTIIEDDDLAPSVSLAIDRASISEASTFSLDGNAGPGLLAGNENPAVTGGTGGFGPGGIVLDAATNTLNIDVLWGSGNGFTDLTGDVVSMHIHGSTDDASPTGFGQNAPVLVGLDGLAGFNNSASNGGFTGAVVLTDEQEAAILANRTYINVHTEANPAGEIRGHLVADSLATVTATLSLESGLPVTVDLGYSGTATNETDYTANSQIVIPAGSLSASGTILAIDDLLDEPDETVIADIIDVINGSENGEQQVTTTIIDDDKGTLIIVKDTVPNDAQDFVFTTTGGLSPSTFTLDDDDDGTLSNTQTYANITTGAYTVTETPAIGFVVSVSCTDPDGGTTTAGATANIDLDVGETVTCTFTNARFDDVELTKIGQLLASDGAAGDYFGTDVAVSSDTVVVGAPLDGDAGRRSGSAYVYDCSSGSCSEVAKLTASDGAAGDQFGQSLAVSGNTIVVGAPFHADAGAGSGAAYVYRCEDGSCSELAKLTASDADVGDYFGVDVAIDGNTIVVGASGSTARGTTGSAYLFTCDDTSCTQVDKLTASDAAAGDQFGRSVAISGETVVVGAPGDDDAGASSGSAYVFNCAAGSCSEVSKLTASDAAAVDRFGASVDVAGSTVVVGAPNDVAGGIHSGSAYVFGCAADSCTQLDKLTASNAAKWSQFGTSVAIATDGTVVVGAALTGPPTHSGSAIVFISEGSDWTESQRLDGGSTARFGDMFGASVDVDRDRVVVGVPRDDDAGANAGSACVFSKTLTAVTSFRAVGPSSPSAEERSAAFAAAAHLLTTVSRADDAALLPDSSQTGTVIPLTSSLRGASPTPAAVGFAPSQQVRSQSTRLTDRVIDEVMNWRHDDEELDLVEGLEPALSADLDAD